jgi:ATP-dependent protease ClpP protease subunit
MITIYITGEIGVDVTLLDVIKQVTTISRIILVKIDSVGGYVDCGNDIYNYLKNLDVPVTTYTTKAYSIASVIFMAGETRVIPEGAIDALMIHLPWMEAAGNHSELTDYLKELKIQKIH